MPFSSKFNKTVLYGMNRVLALFFVIFFCTLHSIAQRAAPKIVEEIDWASFLSRHDLVWDRMPDDYFNAPFLGNGLLGAMLN